MSSQAHMISLGSRLKQYRLRLGLDVAAAARRLEVAACDIQSWEAGARVPPRLVRLGLEAILAADEGTAEADGADARQLRLALDSADMYAFSYDATVDQVRRIGALKDRFGLSETGTGSAFAEAVHPDDRARLLSPPLLPSTPAPGTTPQYRLRTVDGDWRWLQDIAAPIETTDGGAPRRYVGITQDITDRIRAERSLRRSEQRLRLAVDVGRVGIWDWDIASGEITWSEQHYRFAGYGIGGVRPSYEAFVARVHPADLPRVEERLAHARAHRKPYACTFRFVHPDGTVVHADALGRFYYRDGVAYRMVGAVRDVTEIIEAQALVGESRRRLETALEAGDMGTFEVDLDTRTMEIDARQAQLLGLSPDTRRVPRSAIDARIHPDDRERDRTARDATEHHGAVYRNAFRIRLDDGSHRWLMGVAKRVVPASGPPRIAGVTFDISEQKAADERQTLLMREVDHRAKNMLATIQAMVMLTARDKADVASFVTAIQQRIGAMAHVHKLIAATRWRGARLRSIIDAALAPIVVEAPAAVRVDGPDIVLAPKAAIAVAITLHELVTNAVSYGSLSRETGRVDVGWAAEPTGSVSLHWAESGGPPVSAPARKGFGTRLIESSVCSDAGGDLTMTYEAAGLTCDIHLPPESGRPASA